MGEGNNRNQLSKGVLFRQWSLSGGAERNSVSDCGAQTISAHILSVAHDNPLATHFDITKMYDRVLKFFFGKA